MKKTYEAPKVEKMAFNYSDTVVASTSNCHWVGPFSFPGEGCNTTPAGEGHYEGNML